MWIKAALRKNSALTLTAFKDSKLELLPFDSSKFYLLTGCKKSWGNSWERSMVAIKHWLCLLLRPPWSTWVMHLFTASAQNTYFKVKNRWLNVFRAQGKKFQKQKTPILTSTHHHNCKTATFCFYVWLICTQNISALRNRAFGKST